MKTSEKTLVEIYNIANKEVKEKMELEYPTLFKKETLLQQAVNYLSEKDEEVIKLRKLETVLNTEDNLLAEQKLVVIFKHKNEKHIFNWDDSNEEKWYLWWYLGKNFRLDSVGDYFTDSTCSARLCLKTRELAEKLSKEKEIMEYYKLYLR